MKTARVIVGFVILALSIALLLWATWPSPRITRTLDLAPAQLALPTAQ